MGERESAALVLGMFFASPMLCILWHYRNRKLELFGKLKRSCIGALKALAKRTWEFFPEILFAFVYFHLFIVILIVLVWPNIRVFFDTVLQGQTSFWVIAKVVLKNGLLILLFGTAVLVLYEMLLRVAFGKDLDKVFKTVTWLGNTVLALIGILSIYYTVYPNGIYASVADECLCAEATLAKEANKYLWAEAFLMLFGLGILHFYKMLRNFDQEKQYMCQEKIVSGQENKTDIVMVVEKHGPAGGSGNPLEEAGNSCLPTSPSALHRDYRSRRRRTEPFSSGKRRSYRASDERTRRRRQRGSAAPAADVQQTTGFQEPPAGPAS